MEEELREVEYGQRSMDEEMEEYICELEQGPILGEDDESDEGE